MKRNSEMVKKWFQLPAVHQNTPPHFKNAVKMNQHMHFVLQAKRNNIKQICRYDASTLSTLALALKPTINSAPKATTASRYSDFQPKRTVASAEFPYSRYVIGTKETNSLKWSRADLQLLLLGPSITAEVKNELSPPHNNCIITVGTRSAWEPCTYKHTLTHTLTHARVHIHTTPLRVHTWLWSGDNTLILYHISTRDSKPRVEGGCLSRPIPEAGARLLQCSDVRRMRAETRECE